MSGKYNAARNAFAEKRLSWTQDRILAQLLSAEYRFREDHSPDDLTGTVGEPIELSGKEVDDGWLFAATLKFEQVRGPEVLAIVFYSDSLLIEYHNEIENFPMFPNGGDIEVSILRPGIVRI